MNILIFWVSILLHVSTAMAAVKEGVFTKINSITPPGTARPESVNWQAAVAWSIPASMNMKAGDTFTLHMPYVLDAGATSRPFLSDILGRAQMAQIVPEPKAHHRCLGYWTKPN